jgi:hypothetical protein
MKIKRTLLMASFFICLVSQVSQVSSQGYMGTITTGTGIVPPITVGLSSGATESVGALSSLANLTGTWSIDLRDSATKHIDLQVLQNKELIMGYGDMTQNGAREKVTASGFLAGDRPTLFVSIVDRPEVYRLDLASSGTSLSGRYDAIAAGGARWSGTATGSIALSSPSSSGFGRAAPLTRVNNPATTSGAFVGKAAQALGLAAGNISAGSFGAFVGSAARALEEESGSDRITKSRNSFQSTNGQTMTTTEGTSINTNFG